MISTGISIDDNKFNTPTKPSLHESFLNNDHIDDLIPQPKRSDVSSISLSDQLIGSVPSMSTLNRQNEPSYLNISPTSVNNQNLNDYTLNMKLHMRPHSVSFGTMLAQPPKFKKTIIDHPRIASYAFAFDIDGVLVRGPETIPHGVEAIKYLEGENPYHIKVPYIFVTNGGGKPEKVRAEDLSNRLKTDVDVKQIVQGHTPMKDLSEIYDNVLVIGGMGNTCRNIAKDYGFKNVFTPYDILRWDPSVTPYHVMDEEELKYCECDENIDFSKTKIDAIMVFADSRNWAVDQQIILELLMSKGGYMGTVSETFEDGPPIYFAHSDFIWATNYRLARYGMGALQVSIAALFEEHTGKKLKVKRFGKPQRSTFNFVEKVLCEWRKDILEDHLEELASTEDATTQTSDIFSNGDAMDVDDNYHGSKNKSIFSLSDSDSDNDGDDDGDENEDNFNDDANLLTLQSLNKLKLNKNATRTNSHINPVAASNTTNKRGSVCSIDELPPPSTVYFVGDTPESDIRFANSHDESWFSILVNTGVYKPNTTPRYKPKMQCENVFEAVKFAVEREHQKELEEWNSNAIAI